MSAYDNPTIIKDDSAMAWAQAGTAFSDAFTQSFDKARKERDIKEKEAKLDAENRAKDAKTQLQSQQIFYSKGAALNSEAASAQGKELSTKGANPSVVSKFTSFVFEGSEKIGTLDAQSMFGTVSAEEQKAAAEYKKEFADYKTHLERMIGKGGTNIKAVADGTVGNTNAGNYVYIGNTDAEVFASFVTTTASASNRDVEPDLVYDLNNLKNGMKFSMTTKGLTIEDVKNALNATNPSIVREDKVNQFIADNPNIIKKNKDGTYDISLNKNVNSRESGELFTTIPEPTKEKDLQLAGVYNEKDELNNTFYSIGTDINVDGNMGYSKSETIVKVRKREVDIDRAMTQVKSVVDINLMGLLHSELTDLNKLRGFMTKIGAGNCGVEYAKSFVKLPLEEQVNTLSSYILESYKKGIMNNNNVEYDKKNNKYYQVDRNSPLSTGVSTPKDPNALTATQQRNLEKEAKEQTDRLDRIQNPIPGQTDKFEYKGKKLYYDGANFRAEAENGRKITKEAALKYMSTGT